MFSTSARILVQAPGTELAKLVVELLEPYRYELHQSTGPDETNRLVRAHGPFDLVLSLDDDGSPNLATTIREIAPDTAVLRVPRAKRTEGQDKAGRLETPGVVFDAGELMDLLERALATRKKHPDINAEVLRSALIETIQTYSLLLEQFAFVNGGNSRLVMEYAIRVARELGLSPFHTDEVGFAALLQDIGIAKLNASRKSELTPAQVREHPIHGSNLIERLKLPWRIRPIIVAHHEAYNGLGYPRGLHAREIPLGARILAVVNAFFSMISRRPNRAAIDKSEALKELQAQAGRQFDPEVVEVFTALMRDKAFHAAGATANRISMLSSDAAFGSAVVGKFETSGDEATLHRSGPDAMASLKRTVPQAIVLDSLVDEMSGFQMLHWIRKDPYLAKVPVLILADQIDGPENFLAHDMGADDFLYKPVRLAELVSRVHALIRRQRRLETATHSQIHEGEGLRGRLDELGLPAIVHMLVEGRKTASVTLLTTTTRGFLGFDCGVLVHARTESQSGEQAFFELFRIDEGDFVIEHGAATAERTIARRMDLLLAEAEQTRAEAEAATVPKAKSLHDQFREFAGEVTEPSPAPVAAPETIPEVNTTLGVEKTDPDLHVLEPEVVTVLELDQTDPDLRVFDPETVPASTATPANDAQTVAALPDFDQTDPDLRILVLVESDSAMPSVPTLPSHMEMKRALGIESDTSIPTIGDDNGASDKSVPTEPELAGVGEE